MNNNDGAGAFFAGLALFSLSPLIFFLGYNLGQNNVRDYNKQVMSEVLAKSCISQPKDCKSYSHYYTAVENFKK